MIGACGSTVTVADDVALCPCTESVAVTVPATVPGSSGVGKLTVVVPLGTARVTESGLLPKPLPKPASPLLSEGKPDGIGFSATVSVPVKAAELVTDALVMGDPGAGWEVVKSTVKVGVG